jgi:molybdate transport system substrate-binding protein
MQMQFKAVRRVLWAGIFGAASLIVWADAALAQTLTIMSVNAMQGALEELRPDFEQLTGDRLQVEYGTAEQLAKRLAAGRKADIVIVPTRMRSQLRQNQLIEDRWEVALARVKIGLAVVRGAPKPALQNARDLRIALLGARRVAYNRNGDEGIDVSLLIERLGVAQEIGGRAAALTDPARQPVDLLVAGEADMAIQYASEVLQRREVELVGPLPEDAITAITLGGFLTKDTARTFPSRAFLLYLKTSQAHPALIKHGLDPLFPR